MEYFRVDDYPDLRPWNYVEEFSLEEAALLLAGIDPFETNLEHVKQFNHPRWKNAHGFARALESAVRQGVVTLVQCKSITYEGMHNENIVYFDIKQSDRDYPLALNVCTISRAALIGWIERAKIQFIRPIKKSNPQDAQIISQDIVNTVPQDQTPLLAYHGHKSDGLDYVDIAIKQLWSTFDPDDPNTAPTKNEVTEYLKSLGATHNMAEAVNLILRPRGLARRTRIKRVSDTN